MISLKDKYDFVCSLLQIQDVDLWERDAMLGMPKRIYFQFDDDFDNRDVDSVVEKLMKERK